MFEANCSRQMGQHKKKIFHRMFLCLRGGVTKVHVSDAQSGAGHNQGWAFPVCVCPVGVALYCNTNCNCYNY